MHPRQFAEYIRNLKVSRKIDKIIFHHTSSPINTWQGSGSMLHYWNLYRSRGWKAGPHLFIAPDAIWLFSPIKKIGKGVEGNNKGVIHIEVVGRYFDGPPVNPELCFNIAIVTRLLMSKFELYPKDLINHFFYNKNANETPYINRNWLESQMLKYNKGIEKIYDFNEAFRNGVASTEKQS